MQNNSNQQDPGMVATLEELRRSVEATYGEERAAEREVKDAVAATAQAIWRVMQEPLDPSDPEPLAHV